MGQPTLNSIAEIVQALLIQLGLGTWPPMDTLATNADWPVYATNEPNAPDNCITTYDTTNQYDGRSMTDGEVWTHWGTQIRVRGIDHPTAYQKAFAIKKAISQQVGGAAGVASVTTPDGNTYLIGTLAKIVGPVNLGQNMPQSKRALFTLNALVVL